MPTIFDIAGKKLGFDGSRTEANFMFSSRFKCGFIFLSEEKTLKKIEREGAGFPEGERMVSLQEIA